MTIYTPRRYIVLDGHKYPVAQDTYFRSWARVYSQDLVGGLIRLGFMDRGPGIRIYKFQLIIQTWKPNSLPYQDGITDTWDTQLSNIEASYQKLATVLQFSDIFGNSPGPDAQYGVFFTSYNQIIPKYMTPQKPYVLVDIEVTEATQQVA